MGVMIIHPEQNLLAIAVGVIAFLAISHIPCMHIMKNHRIVKFSPLILV